MKRGKWIKKAVILTTILILCSGCGREEVEYDIASDSDVLQSGTGENSGNAGLLTGGIREKIGAEERWEEQIETRDGKIINIDAAVEVPDAEKAGVYFAEEKYYTEDEIQTLCEKISEGEVYYADLDDLPKSEIQRDIQKYQFNIEMLKPSVDLDEESREYMINSYMETIAGLQEVYEQAPEAFAVATDFSVEEHQKYLITYRGVDYILGVSSDPSTNKSELWLIPYREDYKAALGRGTLNVGESINNVTYEEDVIDRNDTAYETEDNDCGISFRQAETMALDFLDELGLEGFAVVEYKKAKWDLRIPPSEDHGEMEEEKFTEGMRLVCHRVIHGMTVSGDRYIPMYDTESHGETEEEKIAEMEEELTRYASSYDLEYIEICVTKDGVIMLDYVHPLKVEQVLAEDVNMLDYESALSAMRDVVANHQFNRQIKDYTEMKLMYFRCRGEKEGEFFILPAWRLIAKETEDDMSGISDYIMINAIDGSLIDVASELWD